MNGDHLAKVRDLLAEGMTEDAAGLLRTIVEGLSTDDVVEHGRIRDLQYDMVAQLSSMATTRKAVRRGEISQDDYHRRLSQTAYALLQLADDAERLVARDAVIAAAAMPQASIGAAAPSPASLEKVWGRNNLQELAWLELGVIASRSVCRVVSPAGIGTGFLVGDGMVMTNHHVVPNLEVARNTRLEFNFEQDAVGRLKPVTAYDVAGDASSFATSPVDDLDCTVMRVADSGDISLSHWGTLELAPASAEIAIGDPVTIIQHPNGGQKKIAVTGNEVVNRFGNKLHYMTNTLPGSSGSPVFNDRWQIVALHHAGGNVAKNENGDRFFANEGILIDAIRTAAPFVPFL